MVFLPPPGSRAFHVLFDDCPELVHIERLFE
jgi:hypothetical protein